MNVDDSPAADAAISEIAKVVVAGLKAMAAKEAATQTQFEQVPMAFPIRHGSPFSHSAQSALSAMWQAYRLRRPSSIRTDRGPDSNFLAHLPGLSR